MTQSSILVVEDEAVVALDLKMQLEDMGYAVVGVADTAAQAIDLARSRHPDLVLMDIKLRGEGDGIEAAGVLKRELELPVIFLTSFSDSQTVRRAAETAPYGYLTKPFQIKELAAGVEVALYKAGLERRERRADRWFASTLRCVTDAVVMTSLDETVRFMNPAAEALTGWSLEEAVGRDVNEVVCIPVPVEGLEEMGNPVRFSVAMDQTVEISHSLRLRRRDGSEVFVDEWTGPITEGDQHLGLVVVLRDATPRKRQEDQLQSCEERFRSAFDVAPMGMALVSLDGRILLANEALGRLVGRDAAQLKGEHSERITYAGDRPHEAQRLHELLSEQPEMVQFEKRYLHANGSDMAWTLVIASVMREGDEPSCFLYQVHDLTPQRAAAEQMAELAVERMKRLASEAENRSTREFLSRVSHEMRTPLNAVLGYGQLLQLESVGKGGQLLAYADQVVKAGNHLLMLADDVLEVQRSGVNALRPQLQKVPLADAVREALQLLMPGAEAQHIQLDVQIPADVSVMADPLRLRQVLLNIGSNAVKYNRPRGQVRWCLETAPAGRVRLCVEDDGIGMTQEQLTKLFKPFERLGQEHSGVPGTGLGLIITRSLVEQMGGTMSLHSEPRKGTRVDLEFASA